MTKAVQTNFCSDSSFFAFHNANHSKMAPILLNQDIYHKSYGIIFLNEPYYTNCGISYFDKRYIIIFYQEKSITAIIIANRNYKYTEIVVERDLIIVDIDINGEKFIFIHIYIPPSETVDEMLNKLEYYVNRILNKKVIIVGDFNSKFSLWGIQRCDSGGNQLLDFVIKQDITILNDPGSLPTFDATIGRSWIGIVMYRNININEIGDFTISDEINMSDHNLILFKLKNYKSRRRKGRLNLKDTNDWNFAVELNDLLDQKANILNNIDIDSSYKIQKKVKKEYILKISLKKRERKTLYGGPTHCNLKEIEFES